MRTLWIIYLIIMELAVVLVSTMPHQQTTPRTPQQIGDTIKMLTNQLMDMNITSSDMVLDTRTPPRVRQQTRREKIEEPVENSHAGIAVPIDEESILLEESTKKLHFYKVDKPTTDSGLSTWILLSGNTASPTLTTKTSKKPPIKQNTSDVANMTVVISGTGNKIMKPVFKKRQTTTTRKPTSTTPSALSKTTTVPVKPEKTTKLTKVKASILNNAVNNKTKLHNFTLSTKKPLTTTTTPISKVTTTSTSKTVELIKVSDSSKNDINKSVGLPIEAKNEEFDLDNLNTTTQNPKKTRRPTNKRKKNKNRRKRPNVDKNDTSNSTDTKVATNSKEKPIGTQIYNYLSREVMPTVGVGLVGLMVTAGLASYFLYPFGTLRRSYDIDRKDKDNSYYYRNEYTGGIAEEEAIGKVIAGMPSISNYNSYSTKSSYPISNVLNSNVRYRQVDHRYSQPQSSVETVKINPDFNKKEEVVVENMYVPQETYNPHYTKEILNDKKIDNKQFVVGNIPKEYMDEVTPIAVPEHGPRSMKIRRRRRRRQIDYKENDIFSDEPLNFNSIYSSTLNVSVEPVTTVATTLKITTKLPETTTRNVTQQVTQEAASFLDLFKDILHIKIKMGLELLQNTTQTISRYISRIQKRVNETSKSS